VFHVTSIVCNFFAFFSTKIKIFVTKDDLCFSLLKSICSVFIAGYCLAIFLKIIPNSHVYIYFHWRLELLIILEKKIFAYLKRQLQSLITHNLLLCFKYLLPLKPNDKANNAIPFPYCDELPPRQTLACRDTEGAMSSYCYLELGIEAFLPDLCRVKRKIQKWNLGRLNEFFMKLKRTRYNWRLALRNVMWAYKTSH